MKERLILSSENPKSKSSIQQIVFNHHHEEFLELETILEERMTYSICMNSTHDYLFALIDDQGEGTLVVLHHDEDCWEEITRLTYAEIPGCFVAFCDNTQTLYVVNDRLHRVDVLYFDGQRIEHIQSIQYESPSIQSSTDSILSIQHIAFDHFYQNAFVCNYANDVIYSYTVNKYGFLRETYQLQLPEGTGPVQLVVHPSLPYVYILGIQNHSISIASLDSAGQLALVNKIELTSSSDLSEPHRGTVVLSNKGTHLYMVIENNHWMTVFEISSTGSELTEIQSIDVAGDQPRNILLSHYNDYLLCTNYKSGNFSLFRRNPEDGTLTFINNHTHINNCTSVLNY